MKTGIVTYTIHNMRSTSRQQCSFLMHRVFALQTKTRDRNSLCDLSLMQKTRCCPLKLFLVMPMLTADPIIYFQTQELISDM